jgi:hypothetical protein
MAEGYPKANMSRKKAENALTALLYGCTDERLRGFTAEGLAASYNVPLPRAGEMLAQARRGRRL